MADNETLTCGHAPTPTDGPGTGYARTDDGRTLCYSCADDAQRAELDALEPGGRFVAYLSDRGNPTSSTWALTTWPGGHLADVRVRTGQRISPTCSDGVRFVSSDGRYYGTSPGPGMYAIVRRYRDRKA